MINLNGLQMMNEQKESEEKAMLMKQLEEVQAKLVAAMSGNAWQPTSESLRKIIEGGNVKKNQTPGKAHEGRMYVLLTKRMDARGKVPQQQADIARILSEGMEVNEQYTEAQVFAMVVKRASEFPKLCNSVQDPTYLFRYYRGLKNDGTHAGFIARNFLRMIG